MTNATHTQGPWHYESGRVWHDSDNHEPIAYVDDAQHGKLIAAAPDMLAALQEAVNKGYMWDNDPELWAKASAAIAKAKGESGQ